MAHTMTETQMCTSTECADRNNPAVAKVRRMYGEMFSVTYTCKSCLREMRHLAARYNVTLEVEEFNRRVTDKLGKRA